MLHTHTIKVIGLMLGVSLLVGCTNSPQEPGKYAETAKCLTEKGVIMYGTFWCSHCENQKKMFGGDVQFITYQECDEKGVGGDRQKCLAAGVSSYPTWTFPGQGNLVGEQDVFVLAKLANCQDTLPEEDKQALEEAELTTEVESVSVSPVAAPPVESPTETTTTTKNE
jgi:hypothetical protein